MMISLPVESKDQNMFVISLKCQVRFQCKCLSSTTFNKTAFTKRSFHAKWIKILGFQHEPPQILMKLGVLVYINKKSKS